jgi:hypothetical protein
MKLITILSCVGALALAGCTLEIGGVYPQKVANCTADRLDFRVSVPKDQEYSFAFVLELSKPEEFNGEMVVTQGSGVATHLPISSQNAFRWSMSGGTNGQNLSGYCLVEREKLSHIFVRGQTYDVHVTFDKRPPNGCPLWFISMP